MVIKRLVIIILWMLAIFASANGQEDKKEKVLVKNILDFEGAVYELESNYAGFSDKISTPDKFNEYIQLKTKLHKSVKKGRNGADAVGELYGWFCDNHLRTGLLKHDKYRKTRTVNFSTSEGVKDYNPMPFAQKIDDKTFFIRFPSCSGYPSLEWINESIKKYQESSCEYLIIDIRGNGGGQDVYYKPYLKLLYDRECISKGVELRNSVDNINFLRTFAENMPWLDNLINEANKSVEEFVPLVKDFNIKYDSIYTYPTKAAIIIDSNVASSAEQFLLDLKGCSSRTKIYGKGNSMGCLDYSNLRRVDLKGTGISTWIPMTRSTRLPHDGIDETGIAPDVRITLCLPKKLTDNVDKWVLWVAEQMKN